MVAIAAITAASANLYDLTAFSWGPASALSASGVVELEIDGFLAGGGLGYDWQFTDRFVAGLRRTFKARAARRRGLANIVPNPNALGLAAFAVTGAKLNRNLEYLGNDAGAIGLCRHADLLADATGGLAFGGVNEIASFRQNAAPSLLSSGSAKGSAFENSVGWTAGAGVEYAFTRQLSAKFNSRLRSRLDDADQRQHQSDHPAGDLWPAALRRQRDRCLDALRRPSPCARG